MSTEVSMPDYLGARAFEVSLSGDTPLPRSGATFIVDFNYDGAVTENSGEKSEGLVLPLVLQMTAPDGRVVVERVFDKMEPDSADLTPDQGGPHMIRIVEQYHNHWFGSLIVEVAGDGSNKVP